MPLHALTVVACAGVGDERPDDCGEGAGCPVDHAGAPAEDAARQAHHPGRVQRDRRLDMGHEGEGYRLGDLREADGDPQQHLAGDVLRGEAV